MRVRGRGQGAGARVILGKQKPVPLTYNSVSEKNKDEFFRTKVEPFFSSVCLKVAYQAWSNVLLT